MRFKVLISSSHLQSRLPRYRELLEKNNIDFDVITRPQAVSEADLLKVIEPYDAIVASDDEITDKVLAKAKNLKVISKWGVGMNSIDLESAERRGIAVYNSPGAFSESCATAAFSFILHFARGIAEQDKSVRSGEWKHIPGISLSGKTLGIIGVGNIGKALAKRATGFEMKIIGNDVKEIDPEIISKYGIKMLSKEELLHSADFLVLSPDLNPTSLHLIGAKELSLMKSTAFLINVSRGPIIDEPALVKALENKTIAGAGLDVFEIEPLPMESPLRRMANVVLTPHNSYNTAEAENYVHDNTVNNLIEGIKKLV